MSTPPSSPQRVPGASLLYLIIPVVSFLALCIACTDSNHADGRHLAQEFSGPLNKFYIASGVLFLLIAAIRARAFWPARWGLEFSTLCLLSVNILRLITRWPRPPHMEDGVPIISDKFSAGFPSSHTAFAFGLAWLLYEINPRLSVFWFAFAVAIGWSRIEIDAHYPYQVIAGALLGIAIAYWIAGSARGIWASIFRREKKSGPPETTSDKITPPKIAPIVPIPTPLP